MEYILNAGYKRHLFACLPLWIHASKLINSISHLSFKNVKVFQFISHHFHLRTRQFYNRIPTTGSILEVLLLNFSAFNYKANLQLEHFK